MTQYFKFQSVNKKIEYQIHLIVSQFKIFQFDIIIPLFLRPPQRSLQP